MAEIKLKRYIAAIVVKHGTAEELTRASQEIVAADDDEAAQKANEWMRTDGTAQDGDVLQIVENGRGVKTIPLRVVP